MSLSLLRSFLLSCFAILIFVQPGDCGQVAMGVKPIDPFFDSRVEHKWAQVNGKRYHYLLGVPKGGKWNATVFLVCIPWDFLLCDS